MSELTETEHTPTMRQYRELKKQFPDCLLFYRMGDFFELFFEDAILASKALDIALTKRGKQGDGSDIPMCGVPVHTYELYLTKLIQKGFRVALCDQLETPEEARRRGAKGPLKRAVVRIVTRGTLTEENLLTAAHNYLAVLAPAQKNGGPLALAIADISTGFFGVETITQDDLFNTLARWDPAEIIVADNTFSALAHLPQWESWKERLTLLPELRFDAHNAEHLLCTTYGVATLEAFATLSAGEVRAAGVLVDYVLRTQCSESIAIAPPKKIQNQAFLAIDCATRRNLELTTSHSASGSGSLLQVIDKTVTAAGRRLLIDRLATPLLSIGEIEKRLDKVDFFLRLAPLGEQIRTLLRKTQDLERVLARVGLGRASPRDLGAIRATLLGSQEIARALAETDAASWWSFETLPELTDKLKAALADELPTFVHQGGFIAPGFDEPLDTARQLQEHSGEAIQAMQERYANATKIHNLRIRRNNVWGLYIEVSSGQKDKVPFSFIHRQTLTNNVRYTTDELATLERSILQAEAIALAREAEIFQKLCKSVLDQKEKLQSLSKTLADLDIAAMAAVLARENNYVRPAFSEDTRLGIKNGRHPVIEQVFQHTGASFCGNDCDVSPKQRFWLVTGPNMAGKSTFLRQNALIVIMAQMGLFVPADTAHIGIVDRIFSRIGAADDLAYGRSTFMVEMIETAAILHQATERSFVILDEIGRGTATYDGLAIAWAVSEHLYNHIQCRTLFATHYHELVQLSEHYPAIHAVTAAVQEWEGKIIFLHRIVAGAAQRSYGIHVAQLAGVPKAVIQRAATLLDSFENTQKTSTPVEKQRHKSQKSDQKALF